jgi:hypothetical protein
MTRHARITRTHPVRLCNLCRVEDLFTDRVCHAPTSMMSLELIRLAGHCERCGGSVERSSKSGARRDAVQRLIAEAYRDGQDSAHAGEPMPDGWELYDKGYSLEEAIAFQRAYQGCSR